MSISICLLSMHVYSKLILLPVHSYNNISKYNLKLRKITYIANYTESAAE